MPGPPVPLVVAEEVFGQLESGVLAVVVCEAVYETYLFEDGERSIDAAERRGGHRADLVDGQRLTRPGQDLDDAAAGFRIPDDVVAESLRDRIVDLLDIRASSRRMTVSTSRIIFSALSALDILL